jgi:AcrR family transcriptional regulator
MPRVSEAHLAARRRQIIDAARVCFLRNGFHQTSMQDVIAEAGISVGAVYRYFKGKNDIIDAIAAEYSDQIGAVLRSTLSEENRSLADAMTAAVQVIDKNTGPDGPLRIAVQVWAEALPGARSTAGSCPPVRIHRPRAPPSSPWSSGTACRGCSPAAPPRSATSPGYGRCWTGRSRSTRRASGRRGVDVWWRDC